MSDELSLCNKMVLLGKAGAGKSAIVERLTHGHFAQTYKPTVGCGFAVWSSTQQQMRFGIWDTSGADRFRTLAVQQCNKAAAVVFIFSVCDEESFKDAVAWMTLIKWQSASAIVGALVGTHVDIITARTIEREAAEALAQQHGLEYSETSAKSGYNVEAAFELIAAAVNERAGDFHVGEHVEMLPKHACSCRCVLL